MTLEEFVLRLAQGPLPEVPETAPRPGDVEDVLELLDDGDTDLSAFLERPGPEGPAPPGPDRDAGGEDS
jgi:hypothetical protein